MSGHSNERRGGAVLARLRALDAEGFERAREAGERFARGIRERASGLEARHAEPAHVFELVRGHRARSLAEPGAGADLPAELPGEDPDPATPLHFASWLELARRYRTGALQPLEHVEALLERIEALDADLHAFLHLDRDGAREAARAAGERIARGRALGPFDGIPFGLKDIIDAAGLPTTCHSAILRENVAREDAVVTRRLRQAGGVLLGKLATHEFALGGPSFDLPWPPARNPWDRSRFPGGSSSGSGVAVAAGMLPLALGTDTGGSVRNPASQCALVGMKPTYGRVSRRGVFPLAFSLDHVGPLTRSVAENAAALEILAGFDPGDPGSAECADGGFTGALGQGVEGLRVGVLRHFHERDMVADPEMGGAIDRALDGGDVINVYTRSNFGFAFHEFWKNHLSAVDNKTTVIILGDARNNYNDAKAWCIRDIQNKAKNVVWLNPESPSAWGFGDSVMDRYMPYCDIVEECRNLRQLSKVVDQIVL